MKDDDSPPVTSGNALGRLFGLKGRKQKPWQRPSDHTPHRRLVLGRLKHTPGQTTGPACSKCKVAVKRIRRRIDGHGPKVKITECPRCKAWGLARTVT